MDDRTARSEIVDIIGDDSLAVFSQNVEPAVMADGRVTVDPLTI